MLNFIIENFWNFLIMFMGGISILFSFLTYREQNKLKKHGLIEEAKFIGYSQEKGIGKSPSIKVPLFVFWYKSDIEKKYYTVKGKTNSSCKSGETTPIYFNPENPEKEYYLPKKDFLMKYILLFLGTFFLCLGYLLYLDDFNNIYFSYLILSLFIGTLLLYLIGKLSNMRNTKKI